GEGAGVVRDDAYARDLARLDDRLDVEVGRRKAMLAVERRQLEDDGLAHLELDRRRRELEALGADLDDALGPGRLGGRREREEQDGDDRLHLVPSIESSVSASARSGPVAATSRKPRPRRGCSGSHATGAFFGTDIGAGSGKMSDLAAWCSMS